MRAALVAVLCALIAACGLYIPQSLFVAAQQVCAPFGGLKNVVTADRLSFSHRNLYEVEVMCNDGKTIQWRAKYD